ncbi:WYL domain-containing protein [Patulibacter sp. SYSU D01012]|uniref:helix-turn-helix transcriptional regulator n=1 Tax=Patulibacter sp. SYSU D01012 TaxID=2817381 RepID=UPI001B314CB6|nr:WYL domain-containing protein [Patulibacter sp. SYSU D01012]
MADPTTRMLRLLSLLQTHRFWPGGELSGRLGVSPRTLRRDVERLRELGYPVAATRGAAGGYRLEAGADLPPLLLDDDEAVAIAVGLRSAAGGAVAGMEETSVRALAKLEGLLPTRLRRRVHALGAYTVPLMRTQGVRVDADTLTTIAAACRDDERLRLRYRRRDGEERDRTVEPHRLVCVERYWYLVAWDLHREDWRTFRVDRMGDVRASGTRFVPKELPAPDAATFVARSLGASPTRYAVDATVEAPAAVVAQQVRPFRGTAEPEGEGRCRLRMQGDSLPWLAAALALLDADFTLHGPPELQAWLDRLEGRLACSRERAAAD